MTKIDSLNTTDSLWPNDIPFGEKATQDVEKLYHQVEPQRNRRKIHDTAITITIKAKYHTKELKKFAFSYRVER